MELKLKLKPVVPKRLFFTAELTAKDTIRVVISDTRGRFVIEKSLTSMEVRIFRSRGEFDVS